MSAARQKGSALLVGVLLLMLALAGLTVPLLAAGTHAGTDKQMRRQQLRALYEAERALLAHALIEDNTPGSLPSPSAEGAVNGRSNPVGYAGTPDQPARRLPWHFLGLAPSGECIWYAASRTFRNNLPTRQRSVAAETAINPGVSGGLVVHAANGARIDAAAVLIAPGDDPDESPRRLPNKAPLCMSGPIDAFLEGRNRNGDGHFASGAEVPDRGNDIVRPVSAGQLLAPVLRRVLSAFGPERIRKELVASAAFHMPVTLGTIRCGFATGEAPCAGATAFDSLLTGKDTSGLVYSADCPITGTPDGTTPVQPISWLCFNGWYEYLTYQPDGRTLVADAGNTLCTLELDTGGIRCSGRTSPAHSEEQASR